MPLSSQTGFLGSSNDILHGVICPLSIHYYHAVLNNNDGRACG